MLANTQARFRNYQTFFKGLVIILKSCGYFGKINLDVQGGFKIFQYDSFSFLSLILSYFRFACSARDRKK